MKHRNTSHAGHNEDVANLYGKRFVSAVETSLSSRSPSVGLGEDVRLRGERIVGSGLELDGELIQLSAFRSEDGGRRAFGRIARPSRRG